MTSTQDGQVVKRTNVKKTISGRKSRVRLPEWVTINVGGTKFMTRREHFKAFPDALLGKELYVESPHYNRITGEFMFDRNPVLFQYILDYYRTGDLHFPHNFCGPTIKKELYYWGIDENDIAPCCWSRYKEYDEQQETLDRLGKGFNVLDKFDTKPDSEVSMVKQLQVWQRRIWFFLEDPRTNIGAKLWASFYMLLIVASVLTLALETHENFRIRDAERESSNVTTNVTISPKLAKIETTKPHPVLTYIDIVVNSIFALVLLLRLIACPNKVRFFQSWTNLLDIIVVVSQWVVSGILFVPRYYDNRTMLRVYNVFNVLRIARVFLIFKLARFYTGLRILLLALKASVTEILLLIMFMVIGMFIFSTLIFYAELSTGGMDHFGNIPVGFWWSIITMTTVGYGDVHPLSHWGYFVGALCAVSGMLATGLPIPIIANNFTLYYSVAKLKSRMDTRHEKPGLLSIKAMKDKMKKMATDISAAAKDVFKNKSSESESDIEEEDEEALKEEAAKGERCGDGTPANTAPTKPQDGKISEARRKIENGEKQRSTSPMPALLELPEKGTEDDTKKRRSRSRSSQESGDSDKKSKDGDNDKKKSDRDSIKDKKDKKEGSSGKPDAKDEKSKEKKKGDKEKESPAKSDAKEVKPKKEEDAKQKKDAKDPKLKEGKVTENQKQDKGKPGNEDKKDKKSDTSRKSSEKDPGNAKPKQCVKYKGHATGSNGLK